MALAGAARSASNGSMPTMAAGMSTDFFGRLVIIVKLCGGRRGKAFETLSPTEMHLTN